MVDSWGGGLTVGGDFCPHVPEVRGWVRLVEGEGPDVVDGLVAGVTPEHHDVGADVGHHVAVALARGVVLVVFERPDGLVLACSQIQLVQMVIGELTAYALYLRG